MVLATRRIELWATLAKTAFRSSLKKEALSRAAPSREGEREVMAPFHTNRELPKRISSHILPLAINGDLHPRMRAVPTVMMVPSGVVKEGRPL